MSSDPFPEYTVIFLVDSIPPTKLILLRRAMTKSFAPGLYTGIGGKIEPGEDALAGAVRELEEEAGITDVPLIEFGRVIVRGDNPRMLHYFFGISPAQTLPFCSEGTLEWAEIEGDELWARRIIPNTRAFLEEWRGQRWDTVRTFTLSIKRDDADDLNAPIMSRETMEGLHEN